MSHTSSFIRLHKLKIILNLTYYYILTHVNHNSVSCSLFLAYCCIDSKQTVKTTSLIHSSGYRIKGVGPNTCKHTLLIT